MLRLVGRTSRRLVTDCPCLLDAPRRRPEPQRGAARRTSRRPVTAQAGRGRTSRPPRHCSGWSDARRDPSSLLRLVGRTSRPLVTECSGWLDAHRDAWSRTAHRSIRAPFHQQHRVRRPPKEPARRLREVGGRKAEEGRQRSEEYPNGLLLPQRLERPRYSSAPCGVLPSLHPEETALIPGGAPTVFGAPEGKDGFVSPAAQDHCVTVLAARARRLWSSTRRCAAASQCRRSCSGVAPERPSRGSGGRRRRRPSCG